LLNLVKLNNVAICNEYFRFSDQNRFNKKLKDTTVVERVKLVLDVELQDQTAPADWYFNDERIQESER
jgi:hypothetical protein